MDDAQEWRGGTKHVFAGTSRVVSKLVKQDKANSKRKGRIVYEKDQYYYHPDHLGTTAYITHTNGQIYQHLEYFPFGETWVEEHSNKQRTPYLFTAKELDEETGLYYFGARYYDPRTSVWQSSDPLFAKYIPAKGSDINEELPGMGGIQNSRNIGLYSYSHNNPVTYIDPNGKETWYIGGAGVDGAYIQDMVSELSDVGITNVRAASSEYASFGMMFDAAMVVAWNQYLGDRNYARYKGNVNLNIPEGEQLNFVGYSHGSIVAAQTAFAVATGGEQVDNVVLIGAPINQSLIDALEGNQNIGNIHIVNLGDKGDPIYAGMTDKEIIKAVPTLMKQMPEGEGHFYYAPENAEGNKRRGELAREIKEMGLE